MEPATQDTILIYQMGKVASMTIESTLRARLPESWISRLHFMSKKYLSWLNSELDRPELAERERNSAKTQIMQALEAAQKVKQAQSLNSRVKIITLAREPISTCISAYFQSFHVIFPALIQNNTVDLKHTDQVIDNFLEYVERDDDSLFQSPSALDKLMHVKLNIASNWFDDELKSVFGIDVYSLPFEKSGCWAIYQFPTLDLLLLRFEDLEKVLLPALEKLLGRSVAPLINNNMGDQKPYHGVYKEFLKRIRLPETFIAKRYDTKYARYFYEEDFLSQQRERWLNGSSCLTEEDAGPTLEAE